MVARWWEVGRSPLAPGTAASVVTLPLAYLLNLFPLWGYVTFLIILLAVGTMAAHRAGVHLGAKDHPSIVVDEVAGTLVALMGVKGTGWMALGLLAFRALDILKPPGVKQGEVLPGGLGVMADDLIAGAYSRLAILLLQGLFRP